MNLLDGLIAHLFGARRQRNARRIDDNEERTEQAIKEMERVKRLIDDYRLHELVHILSEKEEESE